MAQERISEQLLGEDNQLNDAAWLAADVNVDTPGTGVTRRFNYSQLAEVLNEKGALAERLKTDFKSVHRELGAETKRAIRAEQVNAKAITETATALMAETLRAQGVEQANADALTAEIERAETAEKANADALTAETERAQDTEQAIADALTAETERAQNADQAKADALAAETERARTEEESILDALEDETDRAQGAEHDITEALADETTRARDIEQAITEALADETSRAIAAEQAVDVEAVNKEAERAKAAEQANADAIATEIGRAQGVEQTNATAIANETTRAQGVEQANATAIAAETTRAQNAEQATVGVLSAEIQRAQTAEQDIAKTLWNEIGRAETAEQANADALTAETERAQGAEQTNATAIANETTRAKAAEQANADTIAAEATRAKAAEQTNATAIATETTRAREEEESILDALADETDRAQTAEQTNATSIVAEATTRDNADIVALTYTDATHILALTKGGGDALTQALPIASDTADGFMPKEAHAQLVQNTANIASLSANAFRALGTIQQKTPDVTNALLNAFVADLGLSPKLNYSIKDLDNLTWLCNDITTDPENPAWVQWGDSPIDQATNETLGVVKGDESTAGKVFVEADGSLSLNGWDALNADVAARAQNAGVLVDNPGTVTPPAPGAATVWDVLQAILDNLKSLAAIKLMDEGADPALPSTNPSTIPQLLQQTRNTLKSLVGGITSYFPDNTLTTENGGLGSDASQVFTPENAGKLLVIGKDGKISSENNIFLNDSIEEQNTGLTWIDDEPYYKKSFTGIFPSSNSYQTYQTLNIPHGISNYGTLRTITGNFRSISGRFDLPLVFFISSDSAVDVRIDDTNIIVHHRFNFAGDVQYQIQLEYTKNSNGD